MALQSSWLIWALLSACFAALTALFAKIGVAGIDPDLATLLRTLIVAIVLAPFIWLTGKWSNPTTLPVKSLLGLTSSALATGASWLCYFRALQLGAVSKVAPVDKFSVVLVAVFAVLFLGERPAAQEWLGIVLIGAGVLVLAFKS